MSEIQIIGDRIAVLKGELGISTNTDLERGGLPKEAPLLKNGQISKWVAKPVTWTTGLLEKFLDHYHVSRQWWKTGEGEIFITHTQIEAAIPQNMEDKEEIYSRLVEGNSDYRLIPKTVLEGKYVIVLESQAGQLVKAYEIALKGRQELIETLKEEIRELRSSPKVAK